MATARNTAIRDQHRRVIRRTQPPCGICGEPIDYSLPYLDPMEFVVDHIVPLGANPSAERLAELDVLENKQAAHRMCNRTKSDKTEDELTPAPRTFVTWRQW